MVREENVKLMSRIAVYEKNDGRTEIPMHCFYKADYVRLQALKTVVYASVTFVLIVAIVAVYRMDDILSNLLKIDYKRLAFGVLLLYAVWIFIYWLIARILYAGKYERSRSNIIIYNHNLKKMQEQAEKEVVKTKGGVVIDDGFINF